MTLTVDGIIQDWDARLHKIPKGRKPRNIKGGETPQASRPPSKGKARDRLEMTVRKIPEVMVKITGGGKNMARIKAHIDYISRNGKVELKNEQGAILSGKEDLRDLRDEWAMGQGGIPKEGERRREAFNIMLSMPPGTDRQAVTNAAREFAAETFGNHQYVMATHNDEAHPHVHLCVKAVDKEGVRLNPRKADLQQWREHFADKLREEGVAANATPRRARGVTRRTEKQATRWIDADTGRASARATKPKKSYIAELPEHHYEVYVKNETDARRLAYLVAKVGQDKVMKSVTRYSQQHPDSKIYVSTLLRDFKLKVPEQEHMAQIKEDRKATALATAAPSSSIMRSHQETIQVYGELARVLARSPSAEDKRLALQIVDFMKQFPAIKAAMSAQETKRGAKENPASRVPDRER